jgi:hypothetical protein
LQCLFSFMWARLAQFWLARMSSGLVWKIN